MKSKVNIIAEPVDVLLADTGTSVGDKSLWSDVGWCEEGQTALRIGNIKSVGLSQGYEYVTGLRIDFKANLLQSDVNSISLLQGFVNKLIDIYLVSKVNLKSYLLKNLIINYEIDFKFSLKKANMVQLKAKKDVTHSNLNNVFEHRFLIGIDNFAKV